MLRQQVPLGSFSTDSVLLRVRIRDFLKLIYKYSKSYCKKLQFNKILLLKNHKIVWEVYLIRNITSCGYRIKSVVICKRACLLLTIISLRERCFLEENVTKQLAFVTDRKRCLLVFLQAGDRFLMLGIRFSSGSDFIITATANISPNPQISQLKLREFMETRIFNILKKKNE